MKTIQITLIALATFLMVSCNNETPQTNAAENNTESAEALASSDQAQKATPVLDATDPASAPIFTLESGIYDFGDVQANSTTERVVEFTNTGASPLIIQSARASCGCTVPEYSKEPIAPGETGSLKVSFQAPGNNGKQTKTVTLSTNSAAGEETFRITANVIGGNQNAPQPRPQQMPQTLPSPNLGQ